MTNACIFMLGVVAHFQGMQLQYLDATQFTACRKRDKGSGSSGGIMKASWGHRGVEVDRFPDPLSMGHKKSSGEPVSTSGVEEEEAAAVGP